MGSAGVGYNLVFVVDLREDPAEYEEVLNGLRAKYQPMGTAEELEVERIALCWWRLKRAWRYENTMNRVALRNFGRRELAEASRMVQGAR